MIFPRPHSLRESSGAHFGFHARPGEPGRGQPGLGGNMEMIVLDDYRGAEPGRLRYEMNF